MPHFPLSHSLCPISYVPFRMSHHQAILGDFSPFVSEQFRLTSDFMIVELRIGHFVKLPTNKDDLHMLMSQNKYLDAFGWCLYSIGTNNCTKSELTKTLESSSPGTSTFGTFFAHDMFGTWGGRHIRE